MPSRRHFAPNKQYTAPPLQTPSCMKGLAARRNNAAVHQAAFCGVRVGSQNYHITYFARRLGLESAVWCGAWGRHSRQATADLQLLGTHGDVTASKIIVASGQVAQVYCRVGVGRQTFFQFTIRCCVYLGDWRAGATVARGSNVSALKSLISTGSVSHLLQRRQGKTTLSRDVPVVFKVPVYPTNVRGILVVRYSRSVPHGNTAFHAFVSGAFWN